MTPREAKRDGISGGFDGPDWLARELIPRAFVVSTNGVAGWWWGDKLWFRGGNGHGGRRAMIKAVRKRLGKDGDEFFLSIHLNHCWWRRVQAHSFLCPTARREKNKHTPLFSTPTEKCSRFPRDNYFFSFPSIEMARKKKLKKGPKYLGEQQKQTKWDDCCC